MPPAPIQELRDLTRTRKQLVAEIARHTQRLQKTLEDANVKLTRVVTDILGASSRAVLAALIAGETDPERLADCTTGRPEGRPRGRRRRGARPGDGASSLPIWTPPRWQGSIRCTGNRLRSISGLFVQDQLLQAPMESADPRLILLEGSSP